MLPSDVLIAMRSEKARKLVFYLPIPCEGEAVQKNIVASSEPVSKRAPAVERRFRRL
jgi:hypothetical protein